MESAGRRIHLMDEIRGFAIFCMVFYHAFFTMSFLFSMNSGLKLLEFFMPIEPFFAAVFIFISGISSQLSHSNLKRGIKLLLISIAISFVTVCFFRDVKILFGILHMLSICIICFGVLKEHLFDKISTNLGIIFSILFFIVTIGVEHGYIGFFNIFSVNLPFILYKSPYLFPFGIKSEEFFSADYFPLFPWAFLFFGGTFLGRYVKSGFLPPFCYNERSKFLSFLGTHSLVIYVVHQPAIWILLSVVNVFLDL